MLDTETKRRIDSARDILVGKIPDPKSQVEQITIALIYKFMDDMDRQAENLPRGKAKFFTNEYKKYAWRNIFSPQNSGQEIVNLYGEALQNMNFNKNVPQLFRDIFKNAYLPYRDPETLKDFLKEINVFEYDHSERLGDAFEYLLSVLGSQGDAGQFRTPRNIIDFMVEIIEPKKNERILDPACGTAGFLISAYKHIVKRNSKNYDPKNDPKPFELQDVKLSELTINGKGYKGEKLTSDNRKRLIENISGYDISPDMVRLSLVNMYLHGFSNPHIAEYDTLSRDEKWDEKAEVILANPPFMSPRGGIKPHSRFSVQSKRSEVLFVDYMAEHLTPQGRAAIIVPEGIIFQTATAYKQLRKMLVDENFLVGVISLPAGLFNPYSGVKTSIIWLDKVLAKRTDKILFVKIENDGFDLGAQRRPIKKNDLPDAYRAIMEYKECLIEGKDFNSKELRNVSCVERKKISERGEYGLNGERYSTIEKMSHKFPMVNLGDVVEVLDNLRKPVKKGDRKEGIYPYYGATGILDYVDEYIFNERLVLVGEDGAKWGSGEKTAFIAEGQYWVNNHAHVLRPVKGKIKDVYLVEILNQLDLMSYITGITVPKLNQARLKEIKIPLPPLSIQQEIVAELDSYQKIIDGARQVVENYKPHIDIDPDWKMVELNKICDVRDGTHDSPKYVSEGYPLITSKNLKDGCIDFSNVNLISELDLEAINKRSKVDDGDILMPMIGTIGHPVIAKVDRKFAVKNVALIKFFADGKINRLFLKILLSSDYINNQFINNSQGSTQKFISLGFIRKLMIPLPDLNTQKNIADTVEQEQGIVDSNKKFIEMYEKKVKDRIAKVWGEK